MFVHKSIKRLITACQLSGLTPFGYLQKLQKWHVIHWQELYSLILIVLNALLIIASILYLFWFMPNEESRARITVLRLMQIILCVQSFTIILELYLKRNQHVNLLNFFDDSKMMFERNRKNRIEPLKNNNKPNQLFTFCLIEVFLIIGVHTLKIVLYKKRAETITDVVIQMYPLLMRRWSGVYSMALINLLHNDIKALTAFAKYLLSINLSYASGETFSQPNKYKRNKWKFFKLYRREVSAMDLLFVQRFYKHIWCGAYLINRLHYWTWPIQIMNLFVGVIFTFANGVRKLLLRYERSERVRITDIGPFGTAIGELLEIFLLAVMCDDAVKDVSVDFWPLF